MDAFASFSVDSMRPFNKDHEIPAYTPEPGHFLFTSESVGEGHPGTLIIINALNLYVAKIKWRIKFQMQFWMLALNKTLSARLLAKPP